MSRIPVLTRRVLPAGGALTRVVIRLFASPAALFRGRVRAVGPSYTIVS